MPSHYLDEYIEDDIGQKRKNPNPVIALDAQGHKITPLGRSIDSFLGQMMGRPAIPQYGDGTSKISDQNRLIEAGITPDMGMDDVMSTGDDNIDINYGIDSSTGYDDVNMDVDALNQALMGPNVDIGIGSDTPQNLPIEGSDKKSKPVATAKQEANTGGDLLIQRDDGTWVDADTGQVVGDGAGDGDGDGEVTTNTSTSPNRVSLQEELLGEAQQKTDRDWWDERLSPSRNIAQVGTQAWDYLTDLLTEAAGGIEKGVNTFFTNPGTDLQRKLGTTDARVAEAVGENKGTPYTDELRVNAAPSRYNVNAQVNVPPTIPGPHLAPDSGDINVLPAGSEDTNDVINLDKVEEVLSEAIQMADVDVSTASGDPVEDLLGVLKTLNPQQISGLVGMLDPSTRSYIINELLNPNPTI